MGKRVHYCQATACFERGSRLSRSLLQPPHVTFHVFSMIIIILLAVPPFVDASTLLQIEPVSVFLQSLE
jgi:hypothetical protein